MASTQQVRAGAAYVELTTRNSAFEKGLEAAKKRLRDFGASARMLGTKVFGTGVAAAAPIAASVAVFASFDDQMLAVKGVTMATAAEFEKLRDKAKELGATTSFTASQVGSLMTELGRAGFKPDQLIEMTGAVMDLARATGTDATTSAGIMAATIRQFGLEATDATRVADGFTAAANKTFNSVEALGEAFQYAGPVAADAGMSLEETLAILGSLGNVGIQGSEAGTALRRLLTLSAAEAEQFSKVFGVATTDAVGNTRPLVDVLGDVANATRKLPTGERMAKFNEVFGLLGITAASAIGKSVVDTRALYKELLNVRGVAAATAKEMDSGLGGSIRILLSSVEGVAIAIGEALAKPLQMFAGISSGTLSGIIKWIEANHQAIQIAALVTVAVIALGAALITLGVTSGLAGMAITGLTTVLGLCSTALPVITVLFGALLSPIGLLILATVALGIGILYATGVGGTALAWLANCFGSLLSDALTSLDGIAAALAGGDIALAARILWLLLKLEWQRGINHIIGLWLSFKKSLVELASSAMFGVSRLVVDASATIEVAWIETINFLSQAWDSFVGLLTSSWHSATGFIRKAWLRLKSLFDDEINVDAELQRIDEETKDQQAASQKTLQDALAESSTARDQRRAEIEQRRLQSHGELDQEQLRESEQRDLEYQQEIAAGQAEVDNLRREWRDAIAAAKNPKRAQANADASGVKSDLSHDEDDGSYKSYMPPAEESLAQSRNILSDQMRQVEVKGSFNALGVQGLGADSLSQRTAKATEQVAANTKTLVDQAKRGRLVFTD